AARFRRAARMSAETHVAGHASFQEEPLAGTQVLELGQVACRGALRPGANSGEQLLGAGAVGLRRKRLEPPSAQIVGSSLQEFYAKGPAHRLGQSWRFQT